ncbi:MAG: ATP-binding protein, partial [Victivallales bacterium]
YMTDTVVNNLIEEERFFTPQEFDNADHSIVGEFDNHGQFKGVVSVYGEKHEDHIIPWDGSKGLPTQCGPFKIAFAEVQGNTRESTLPFDEHAAMTDKMNRIGGLYVYKDGIRILPYGDPNYDWVGLEFRRTKSATYYHFSYRRMFGVIQISSQNNSSLIEKSGREGFQENKAYRQIRDILTKFFVQLAADFFREGGTKAEDYLKRRDELERLYKAEEKRKKFVLKRKADLQNQLTSFFTANDTGLIEKEALELKSRFQDRLSASQNIKDRDLLAKELFAIEKDGLVQLHAFINKYKIVKPKIGLPKNILKDWEDYLETYSGLETVFQTLRTEIENEITKAARDIRETLSRRIRVESSLRSIGESASTSLREEDRKTNVALTKVSEETREILKNSQKQIQDELNSVFADFNRLDLEPLPEKEIVKTRMVFEKRMEDARLKWEQILISIRTQLENISFDGDNSTQDQMEAVEQRMVALEEQADVDIQLAQLGMAVEVINHEFTATIRAVRNNLKQLKAWADVNDSLAPLYNGIRSSFDHLDGYLALFTPLHRRLYRNPVDFQGSDIFKFIVDLFSDRLERHKIKFKASKDFRERHFLEYPSSFYPVYVNLVDNAIFWLKSKKDDDRMISLDLDGNDLLIKDNGPGVTIRDVGKIFEPGFTRKPGGRGMGLHISRSVLQKIDYSLNLDPPVKGQGAWFRISSVKKGDGNA